MPTVPATSAPATSLGIAVTMMATKMISPTHSGSLHLSSLGRAAGRSLADHLVNSTISPSTNHNKADFIADYSTMIETTTANMLGNNIFEDHNNMDILNQQQAAASGSLLHSLDDIIISLAPSNCTTLIHALLASFSVILVSELGDKTFIITAIMAMKNSRLLVFIASALALLLMTILSVGMGVAVTVIPKLYTHYGSIVLFLCFGLKMLKEAYDMKATADGESEFDEVKRSLEVDSVTSKDPRSIVFSSGGDKNDTLIAAEQEDETIKKQHDVTIKQTNDEQTTNQSSGFNRTLYVAPIIIKVFTMVFIAEWGDRSQISTVILAARENVVGVFIGSLSGHILCTGLAVIGGRFIADMISVRTMTLLGGVIFLFFATFAIITGPEA